MRKKVYDPRPRIVRALAGEPSRGRTAGEIQGFYLTGHRMAAVRACLADLRREGLVRVASRRHPTQRHLTLTEYFWLGGGAP